MPINHVLDPAVVSKKLPVERMIDEICAPTAFPLRRAVGESLKLEVRPNAEDDHRRNMDVPASLDNVLEVRLHVPARSDVKFVKEFQRIFGAGDSGARIGKFDRFGGATIVIGTSNAQKPSRRAAEHEPLESVKMLREGTKRLISISN